LFPDNKLSAVVGSQTPNLESSVFTFHLTSSLSMLKFVSSAFSKGPDLKVDILDAGTGDENSALVPLSDSFSSLPVTSLVFGMAKPLVGMGSEGREMSQFSGKMVARLVPEEGSKQSRRGISDEIPSA
jgi:hypothetical protein